MKTRRQQLKAKKVQARQRKLRTQRHTSFIEAAKQRRAKRIERETEIRLQGATLG